MKNQTIPQRVHRNAVRAQLKRGQTWIGFLAGDNVNAYHIIGGWALGFYVELHSIEELEKWSADILCYLDRELGSRVVCWALAPNYAHPERPASPREEAAIVEEAQPERTDWTFYNEAPDARPNWIIGK